MLEEKPSATWFPYKMLIAKINNESTNAKACMLAMGTGMRNGLVHESMYLYQFCARLLGKVLGEDGEIGVSAVITFFEGLI